MPTHHRYSALQSHLSRRLILAALLVLVVLLGLGSRKFGTLLPGFLSSNAGDALWTIALYLCFAIASPTGNPWKLGLAAFGVSAIVEFSQLLSHPWLNQTRSTLPGRLLLGRGFLSEDLIRYFIGAVLATSLDRHFKRNRSAPYSFILFKRQKSSHPDKKRARH